MSDDRWRYDPGDVGWYLSTSAFTAWIAYPRRHLAGGVYTAAAGAADATSYVVAITGPEWEGRGSGRTERYRLGGELRQVKAKLEAAIRRRQTAWETRPPVPTIGAHGEE